MQTPYMRTSPSKKSPEERLATIALVGALHLAAVYALIHTLAPNLLPPVPPLPTQIDIFPTKPPPPLPQPSRVPTIIQSGPRTVDPVPPIIVIDRSEQQGPINDHPTNSQGTVQNQAVAPVFAPARAIAETHTIPAYPPLAVRLNQQGAVRLSLTIDEQGRVTDAVVLGSSGYDTLDVAAVAWVKARWRYQPATRDGQAVPARTEAIVTFRLNNRQG